MIEIDFKNISKKQLEANFQQIVKSTNEVNDFISKKKKKRTFKNTMIPSIINDINTAPLNVFHIISSFYPNKKLRDCANKIEEKLNKFYVESSYRKDVYKQFMKYYKNNYKKEMNKLSDEEKRLVEHTYRDYKRLGLTSKIFLSILSVSKHKRASHFLISFNNSFLGIALSFL